MMTSIEQTCQQVLETNRPLSQLIPVQFATGLRQTNRRDELSPIHVTANGSSSTCSEELSEEQNGLGVLDRMYNVISSRHCSRVNKVLIDIELTWFAHELGEHRNSVRSLRTAFDTLKELPLQEVHLLSRNSRGFENLKKKLFNLNTGVSFRKGVVLLDAPAQETNDVGSFFNLFGTVAFELQEYKIVDYAFNYTKERLDAIEPETEWDSVITLNNTACLFIALSRFAEAKCHLDEAAQQLHGMRAQYDDNIPPFFNYCMASVYNNLGRLYRETGDYEQALNYFRRVFDISETAAPSDDHAQRITLVASRNMAHVQLALECWHDAEQSAEKANVLCAKLQVSQSVTTLVALENHLPSRLAVHKERKAVRLVRELTEQLRPYEILENCIVDDITIAVKLELAKNLLKFGNIKDAKELATNTVMLCKHTYGLRHPLVADALYQLSCICQSEGDFNTACKVFEEAMSVLYVVYDHTHPKLASCYFRTAVVKRTWMNDVKGASEAFEKGMDIVRKVYQIPVCLSRLESLLETEGNLGFCVYDLGQCTWKNRNGAGVVCIPENDAIGSFTLAKQTEINMEIFLKASVCQDMNFVHHSLVTGLKLLKWEHNSQVGLEILKTALSALLTEGQNDNYPCMMFIQSILATKRSAILDTTSSVNLAESEVSFEEILACLKRKVIPLMFPPHKQAAEHEAHVTFGQDRRFTIATLGLVARAFLRREDFARALDVYNLAPQCLQSQELDLNKRDCFIDLLDEFLFYSSVQEVRAPNGPVTVCFIVSNDLAKERIESEQSMKGGPFFSKVVFDKARTDKKVFVVGTLCERVDIEDLRAVNTRAVEAVRRGFELPSCVENLGNWLIELNSTISRGTLPMLMTELDLLSLCMSSGEEKSVRSFSYCESVSQFQLPANESIAHVLSTCLASCLRNPGKLGEINVVSKLRNSMELTASDPVAFRMIASEGNEGSSLQVQLWVVGDCAAPFSDWSRCRCSRVQTLLDHMLTTSASGVSGYNLRRVSRNHRCSSVPCVENPTSPSEQQAPFPSLPQFAGSDDAANAVTRQGALSSLPLLSRECADHGDLLTDVLRPKLMFEKDMQLQTTRMQDKIRELQQNLKQSMAGIAVFQGLVSRLRSSVLELKEGNKSCRENADDTTSTDKISTTKGGACALIESENSHKPSGPGAAVQWQLPERLLAQTESLGVVENRASNQSTVTGRLAGPRGEKIKAGGKDAAETLRQLPEAPPEVSSSFEESSTSSMDDDSSLDSSLVTNNGQPSFENAPQTPHEANHALSVGNVKPQMDSYQSASSTSISSTASSDECSGQHDPDGILLEANADQAVASLNFTQGETGPKEALMREEINALREELKQLEGGYGRLLFERDFARKQLRLAGFCHAIKGQGDERDRLERSGQSTVVSSFHDSEPSSACTQSELQRDRTAFPIVVPDPSEVDTVTGNCEETTDFGISLSPRRPPISGLGQRMRYLLTGDLSERSGIHDTSSSEHERSRDESEKTLSDDNYCEFNYALEETERERSTSSHSNIDNLEDKGNECTVPAEEIDAGCVSNDDRDEVTRAASFVPANEAMPEIEEVTGHVSIVSSYRGHVRDDNDDDVDVDDDDDDDDDDDVDDESSDDDDDEDDDSNGGHVAAAENITTGHQIEQHNSFAWAGGTESFYEGQGARPKTIPLGSSLGSTGSNGGSNNDSIAVASKEVGGVNLGFLARHSTDASLPYVSQAVDSQTGSSAQEWRTASPVGYQSSSSMLRSLPRPTDPDSSQSVQELPLVRGESRWSGERGVTDYHSGAPPRGLGPFTSQTQFGVANVSIPFTSRSDFDRDEVPLVRQEEPFHERFYRPAASWRTRGQDEVLNTHSGLPSAYEDMWRGPITQRTAEARGPVFGSIAYQNEPVVNTRADASSATAATFTSNNQSLASSTISANVSSERFALQTASNRTSQDAATNTVSRLAAFRRSPSNTGTNAIGRDLLDHTMRQGPPDGDSQDTSSLLPREVVPRTGEEVPRSNENLNVSHSSGDDHSMAALERRVAEACALVERVLREREEREQAATEIERREREIRETRAREARERREQEEREERNAPVQESPRWPCEHYQRRCRVKFPCCEQYHPCHRCHNRSGACAEDDRKANQATHLKCCFCEHEQEINESSQNCGKCGAKMSEYFCPICKHFTGVDKNPYHCEKCGICRIHQHRSFHCEVCNVCLDKRLEGRHKCRPDSGHDECCICLEDAFSGCQILPCSHKVHRDCAIAMIQNGVRTCPVCRHPLNRPAEE